MNADYPAIRDSLRELQKSPKRVDVFGSQVHGFHIHPPLPEQEVCQFEAMHRVALPQDYRGFLIHVGNGGAGPYYGLFKLGEMDQLRATAPWTEGGGFVGILSEPFPHTGPWNDLTGQPENDESREDDPEWEDEHTRQMDLWWDETYWNPANVNGAIPICHLGCALRQWLVVTGPEAGNVWCDDRTDNGGLYPLTRGESRRISFIEWYCTWLDEAVQKL